LFQRAEPSVQMISTTFGEGSPEFLFREQEVLGKRVG
jgi:hypothetical protein